ncbi:hypothetical protein [Rubripirellula reticaptiva]|uniref:Uncharacterized protein n=1 Tax=Rubripirellula reticaptiva TaxID=2528013 RepID=A0A5C6E4A3_9BACT|nr:hypothetical protein [Rubripirellula reticaptiva]TWU44483.1 hypothetical protein Poly59_61550 [Rubripirellula reticaptiva]
MPNIVTKILCTVLMLLTQQHIVFSQGQLSERVPAIQLDAIDHHCILHEKELKADPRFELPTFTGYDNLRENGRIYLHCKSSGMVICAAPVKDFYQILVFPRKQSEHFKLEITTSTQLQNDVVDVKSIEQLLRSVRPFFGMGYDRSKEKSRLKIRIEAPEEPVVLDGPRLSK